MIKSLKFFYAISFSTIWLFFTVFKFILQLFSYISFAGEIKILLSNLVDNKL